MAFCMNCGKQLPDGAKFCHECGNKVDCSNIPQDAQRKIVYDGEIHKCPNCGDILDAYEAICETCGYERRGTKAVSSVQELSRKLQEIEANRPTFDILHIVEKRLDASSKTISKIDQQKIDLIKNFPIPNTKEDMYEFLIMASSNVDARAYGLGGGTYTHKVITNAWYTKFEQVYKKAQIAFGRRTDFADIALLYQQKRAEIAEIKKKKTKAIVAIILGALALGTALLAMILMLAIPAARKNKEKVNLESARLDVIVQEVYDALENEDYVLARARAANIVFSGPSGQGGYEANVKYQQIREELLLIIDQAEYGYEADSTSPKIRFGITQENAQNQNYLTVKAQLEKQGFTNIVTVPVEDLVTDWFTEDGAVDKILVDGSSSINEDVLYPVDVEIVIYYHTFKSTSNNEGNDPVKDTSSTNAAIESPSAGTDIVLQDEPIDYSNNVINKGAQYTYGHDEWSLYCATAMSDTLIKIEKWGKTLSTAKTFDLEYEVCAIKITDAEYGFSWLDDNQNAFVIQLQDKQDSDFKKPQTITFTISGTDSDTNKGMNYTKDGVCYSYQNDDWHLYRAIPLSETIIKVECWYRSIAFGSFNYGYDVIVIDLLNENTDFEWTDDEHTAFTISIQDTQNSNLKKMTFVAFSLDE